MKILPSSEQIKIKHKLDHFFKEKGYTEEFLSNVKSNSNQYKGTGKIDLVIKS